MQAYGAFLIAQGKFSNHTKGGKVPSTNKLASHKSSRQPRHHVRGSIARFLLSFCGLASFGVVTKLVALGIAFLVLFAIPVSITLFSTNNTYATGSGNGNSNTITANLPGSVAIRLLDSTGTTEISSLDFNNLTPTPQGTTASKSFIVDVATSNPTGYKLYMQSDYQTKDSSGNPTGNYTTNLTHTDADVADNIPTLVPGSGSSAGTKIYWNYINPLTNSGSSNPTPSVIPPYGTPDKIAQYFSPTNSHQSTIDINVGIDTTIVSGTYENQLLFSAVGNPTTLNYTVSFNTNGGTMSGEDIEETAGAWVHSVTVPGSPSDTDYTDYIPSKADSLFTGWTISIPTGSSATASCNGTSTCRPGDSLNITAGTTASGDIVGDVALTAQYTSISTMQAMTPTICNTAAIGATTTLTDTRDNNTYTIRKLKDGNCWMTQNLRLISPSSSSLRTLSLADSNVALNYQITASDDSTWCDTYDATCINKSMVLDSNNNTYGTYYNWYATTAGTGIYELPLSNATSSVCPKGWRLPTGGEGGEFQALYEFYNSWDDMLSGDPSFVLAGGKAATGVWYAGTHGFYWSSTASADSKYARTLYFNGGDSTVVPTNNGSKFNGISIRCLAHDNSYSILGVDPNGGTWSGSTSGQTFTQAPESTQSISNPSTNASYTISYNMGSTGISTPTSPTSAERSFTGWALSGAGTIANGTYTYSIGNGLLTAQYNSTSNSFNLPTLSKSGYNCTWHQGSASGTVKQNNVTITSDTTFYAVCEANNYTISLSGSNVSVTNTSGTAISSISVPYGGSATFKITPTSGYYLSGHTCASLTGYSCSSISTGESATGTQIITLANNNSTNTGAIVFTGTMIIKYLQDQTAINECKSATTGTTFTLRDNRDNTDYQVRKLADGNCWMIQNLRLLSPTKGYIDSTDSNVNSRIPANTRKWSDIIVQYCSGSNKFCVVDSGSNDYGAYYSWYAATATSGTSSTTSDAKYSICPKGWELPTGGYSGSMAGLFHEYDTYAKMTSASGPNFKPGGYCRASNCPMNQGQYGYYWESEASKSSSAYAMFLDRPNSSLYPLYTDNKDYGNTVRCVAM